jgi:anti-sigma regulatory factor (Ser/Thr protein kinase)
MEVTVLQPKPQVRIPVQDNSQIGEARRAAVRLANAVGADEVRAGKFAIVTTELATNLVRHAGSGDILLQSLNFQSRPMLEVIAIDKGRGMEEVERCFRDGYSTAGSSGQGLGAVARQSDECDIYSAPGSGTVVMSRVAVGKPSSAPLASKGPSFGVICMPYPGEIECGDSWRIAQNGQSCSCMVADGLGHGVQAAQASHAAGIAFENDPDATPAEILQKADKQMRGTRGGAVAIGKIDYEHQKVRFAGVGNIAAVLVTSESNRSCFSHNGIVGHNAHRIQEMEYPWTQDGILVMCSDGLQTRWQLSAYSGLRFRHPAVIAAVLFRDFQRGRDDATVLVVSPPGSWICRPN